MLRPRTMGILGELLGQFNRDDSFAPSVAIPRRSQVPYNVDTASSSARTFGKALDQFNMSQAPTPLAPRSLASQREPFRPPVNLGDTSAVNPGVPANAPMGQRITSPQVAPRIGDRDMGGAGVIRPGADVMGMEKLAEQATQLAKLEESNPKVKDDPKFIDTVKEFFGNRENMLRLAAGFNSMRLRPDTGLATVIGSELKDIRSQRVASRTSEAVADRLEQMGYANEAALVRANPELASSMVTLITKPDKPTSTIGKLADDLSKGRITQEQYDLGVEAIKKSGVNIEMGEKARTQALGQAGKDIFSADIEAASGAQKALESIQKADETLDLLASGAPTTGLTASFRNVIDNALSFIGDEAAINRASDTALLNSLLGQDVFGAIGALGIGARGLDTPAEREFLREVMTGRIDMTDESLRKITALRRRYAERAIKAYNKKLERGDFDLLNKEFGDRYKPIEIPEAPEVIYTEAPEIGFTREYQGATWVFKGGNPYDANNWEKQ